eukprot:10866922-Alexandrium_andersonii.AAC.1
MGKAVGWLVSRWLGMARASTKTMCPVACGHSEKNVSCGHSEHNVAIPKTMCPVACGPKCALTAA